jgi:hypothetical protein
MVSSISLRSLIWWTFLKCFLKDRMFDNPLLGQHANGHLNLPSFLAGVMLGIFSWLVFDTRSAGE